jgi:hypothetical protein
MYNMHYCPQNYTIIGLKDLLSHIIIILVIAVQHRNLLQGHAHRGQLNGIMDWKNPKKPMRICMEKN